MSGSCACVAMLKDMDLFVANLGDARAVLGQEFDDGTYRTSQYTTLIRDGRLLEMLLPLRAFGDVRFKWSQKDLKEYAMPIYGHGKLNYRDKFLTLATDGLWDLLSPERVVQLVGSYLNGQQSYDPYIIPDDRHVKLREVFEDLASTSGRSYWI
ncbi:pyruvate dehydrogenase [acetyl-transferring]-phosphatase mitochondrial-like [Brachionus plicatilis]|uniref:Pyruvate dehydrogenase [acetyl-transferring]-phosphatase mitochondrial-like n=1 Tax=Brachionus plicatilis TaxID=10195 RepID=A0A3M7TAU7_BRAPC|nr:pyruvate dehydrogenase [acetyl-transferring]-phosphatase mitochondrial-like [Brachionus plicatilis]